jgi:hypothetical protein
MPYLAVFAIDFGTNRLPTFGPPTWVVLVDGFAPGPISDDVPQKPVNSVLICERVFSSVNGCSHL